MHKISKDRINIPLVSRTVCGSVGGVLFLAIGFPFLLIDGIVLLKEALKQQPVTVNYGVFVGLFLITLVGGTMFILALSPRFRFKHDIEKELGEWKTDEEMRQTEVFNKRKLRSRIPFFMSRNVLGILAVFASILALVGVLLALDDLPYFTASIWYFAGATLSLSVGLWYVGLSDRFCFRGDPSFMCTGKVDTNK